MAGRVNLPPIRVKRLELYLSEIGMSGATWQEIHAWAQATGTALSRFELTAIRHASRVYNAAIQEFNNTSKPAPWFDKDFDREIVAEQTRKALRG